MNEYEIVTLSLIVKPKGQPIFCEQATIVEMTDEANGPFVVIRQIDDSTQKGEVRMDPEEWPFVKDAVETMLAECNNQANDKDK